MCKPIPPHPAQPLCKTIGKPPGWRCSAAPNTLRRLSLPLMLHKARMQTTRHFQATLRTLSRVHRLAMLPMLTKVCLLSTRHLLATLALLTKVRILCKQHLLATLHTLPKPHRLATLPMLTKVHLLSKLRMQVLNP